LVSVSVREFDRAWRKHVAAYEKLKADDGKEVTSLSRYTLLFYAAECAIKAKLLRNYRVQSYDKLPPEAQIGHKINRGLDLLRLAVPHVPKAKARDQSETTVEHHQLHEAWRYGKILAEGEPEAIEALEKLIEKLECG